MNDCGFTPADAPEEAAGGEAALPPSREARLLLFPAIGFAAEVVAVVVARVVVDVTGTMFSMCCPATLEPIGIVSVPASDVKQDGISSALVCSALGIRIEDGARLMLWGEQSSLPSIIPASISPSSSSCLSSRSVWCSGEELASCRFTAAAVVSEDMEGAWEPRRPDGAAVAAVTPLAVSEKCSVGDLECGEATGLRASDRGRLADDPCCCCCEPRRCAALDALETDGLRSCTVTWVSRCTRSSTECRGALLAWCPLPEC